MVSQTAEAPKTIVSNGLYSILTELFGIKPELAAAVSEKTTEEEFSANFSLLEDIVGKENAEKIVREGVKEGQFIHYRNGYMQHYLNLADRAADKIASGQADDSFDMGGMEKSTLIGKQIHLFYDVASLEQFLKPEVRGTQKKKHDLDISKYILLHMSNANSVRYLGSLIEEGYIEVGRHEHWSRNRDGGVRGTDILKRIKKQLKSMFSELGLNEPDIRLNSDARRLEIDQISRTYLPNIMKTAYSRQRK